jgi:hypothetical protein
VIHGYVLTTSCLTCLWFHRIMFHKMRRRGSRDALHVPKFVTLWNNFLCFKYWTCYESTQSLELQTQVDAYRHELLARVCHW